MATRSGFSSVPGLDMARLLCSRGLSQWETLLLSILASLQLDLAGVDFAAIGVALGLQHIANRDNADQTALVHNRKVTETALGHGVGDRVQVILRRSGDHMTGHDRLHGVREAGFVGCNLADNVPLRDDA